MKFYKKICMMLAVMFCSIVVVGITDAFASSATIDFGTDENSIKAGQTFTLTVIVDSSDGNIGNVEARITYDEEMLEVVSSDDYVNGNAGLLVINDNSDDSDNNKNYNIKFKALKKGSVKIQVSDSPVVYDFDDDSQMTVKTNELNLTIGASADANADSTLAILDVNEGTLEPEFSPDVTSYSLTVPYETEKLYIDAQAADVQNAKVNVVGNDSLKVGANSVIVSVTAEDGSSTDYSISVIKETQDDTIQPGTIEAVIQGTDFTVYEDAEGNDFIQNGTTYQVIELDDDSIIPAGFVKTKLTIYNKISITAYTYQNDLDNEYLLIYCQNVESKDTGFYQYDRVKKTLQRYSGTINNTNVASSANSEGTLSQNQKMTIALVGAILVALVIILLILLIKSYIKIKGLKSDDIY